MLSYIHAVPPSVFMLPRILLVRFSAIGDVVLTTPLIRAIRARHPDARLVMVTKRQYVPLVSDNPHLDEIFGVAPEESLRQVAAELRALRFTHFLDLHGSARSLALRALVPGPWRSYSKRRFARAMLVRTKRNFYREDLPVAERYFEAAAELDVTPDGGPPELFLSAEAVEQGDRWLKQAGIGQGRPLVTCAPAATHATKRWPMDYWIKLIRRIIDTGADVAVLGGPSDSALCAEIATRGGAHAASGAGALGLQESAAVLKRSAALISGDTGVMHMGTAVGTPVVAIFGPTVRAFGFFPYRAHATVLERDLPCRPCSKMGGPVCPLEDHACLRGILPDAVFGALSRTLA